MLKSTRQNNATNGIFCDDPIYFILWVYTLLPGVDQG